MQKTLTIYGKRFTAKQIEKLFNEAERVNCGDYIVKLNGAKFFANYRQIQDIYYAPVCNRNNANAIALMPDNGCYKYTIWLSL